ncbi:hypothetical protein J9253_15445 [Thiothrix litoralis]|uniref:Uncharacterized protein n=1 Tax=Thiothrix litoralis TaxID=2891210 RepID=A0ABX7WQC7_9GAMM|nr:hypothetical protein [Thiothrix litoralis]QTR45387.1 hypothetical protein J9253_15445 [Thiothrix litoralis]
MKKQQVKYVDYIDSGNRLIELAMDIAEELLEDPTAEGAAVHVELAKLFFEVGKFQITRPRR